MTGISSSEGSTMEPVFFGPDIEQRIADALISQGTFADRLSAEDLDLIFANILIALVARQKLHGVEILVESEVVGIDIVIANQQMRVHSVARILRPIAAELSFSYTLENDLLPAMANLRLKNNFVHVEEHTAWYDVVARVALGAIDVRQVAMRELSDPAGIIQRTLPPRLRLYGFTEPLSEVNLRLQDDDTLEVYLTV